MTKKEAEKIWKENILPGVIDQYGKNSPAMRESWGIYTDSLCKGGQITLKQYESWSYPKGIE